MLAPRVATCQVCFDEDSAVVTQICHTACPAVLCTSCINAYVSVQAESALYGVLAQLKCPICIQPTNLVRWREVLGKTNAHLQLFEEKVHAACNVACPNCHTNTSMLPEMCDSFQPLTLPTHLAQHVPELQTRCGQYCRHCLSVDALYEYVRATFRDHDDVILSALLLQLDDVERRATLFLRWRRDAPFITSPCCNAALCFACHVRGHHSNRPCASFEAIDGIAQCPGCKLHLVKGDGCDGMQCFCGTAFSWTTQRRAFQLQSVRPEALATLRRLLRRHLSRLRWSIVQRHLPASAAYYRWHLMARTHASSLDTLAPWLGDNGIELGMTSTALCELLSNLSNAEISSSTATEVTNYACRSLSTALRNVAHLFSCLPPPTTYHSSHVVFLLDGNDELRAVSLRFRPSQMDRWTPPIHAPLRSLSTVLNMADTIVDHGHTVVSLEQLDGLYLEFVDTLAPPLIADRAFTSHLQDTWRRDGILASCRRPLVRWPLGKHRLRVVAQLVKWANDTIPSDDAARERAMTFMLPANDAEASIDDLCSILLIHVDS